jgi:hypothetical protein
VSLSIKAVEWLWARLIAAYGVRFMAQYEGVPVADVKTDWAHRLARFHDRRDVILWALDNLPDAPPNALAFARLCAQAPAPVVPALPEPPADPERMRAELAKLAPVLSKPVQRTDGRDWARRLVARAEAGDRVSRAALAMARDALAGRTVLASEGA